MGWAPARPARSSCLLPVTGLSWPARSWARSSAPSLGSARSPTSLLPLGPLLPRSWMPRSSSPIPISLLTISLLPSLRFPCSTRPPPRPPLRPRGLLLGRPSASSAGRYTNLRSINLSSCESLLELPENIKDMKSLTNLRTGDCYKLTGMPSGKGQLSHLRELPIFVVGEKSECGLRELNGLSLLEGELEILNLENVKNFQQARDANLIEKHGLKLLDLSWGLDTYKRQVDACVHTNQDGQSRQDLIRALALAEKVLEGLQPHENLAILRINGYMGKIFPKWLESSSSLPNLVYLSLYYCFRCETLPGISQLHYLKTLYLEKLPVVKSIPPLGHLSYLKYLSLGYLLSVKSLGSEFYGTGDDAFPVLETLRLEHMPELEEWCEASTAGQQSFPRLNYLSLINCPKLKVLPSSLPSLEQLYLGANYELLLSFIPSGAFPNLKKVYLANFDESISSVPQIVAERLTFQNCHGCGSSEPMDDDELNFVRSVAGLP